ncbi:hypothetical protein [Nitrosovibrio sp. Nv17]|jgi:hypothetical protein|uniref:hypothetical protein n=1 Tax=Nitrosovibrio sp. Nv17 TaxID=1855339 RepID=UPI000908724F|nr:hypothetical protein [Nitrosovibrio sp. Nv17]SFW40762.1 hypothetical protein SAMN05216414_1455 [Nitrosovibrio sp. Nv17]
MPNSFPEPPPGREDETDIAEYFNHIHHILSEISGAETRADLAEKVADLSQAITSTRLFVASKIEDYVELNKRLTRLEKKIRKQNLP